MHNGHVQLAAAATLSLQLDELLYVPAGQPPHRAVPQALPEDRVAMAQLAFQTVPGSRLDDAEVRQSSPSWTIATLERLTAQHPETHWVLILGADAFLGLPTWHRWHALLNLAHIAVANRPGAPLSPHEVPPALQRVWETHAVSQLATLRERKAGCVISFNITPCTVSATQVRQTLEQGQSIHGLVPDAVERYIVQHCLYRQAMQ